VLRHHLTEPAHPGTTFQCRTANRLVDTKYDGETAIIAVQQATHLHNGAHEWRLLRLMALTGLGACVVRHLDKRTVLDHELLCLAAVSAACGLDSLMITSAVEGVQYVLWIASRCLRHTPKHG